MRIFQISLISNGYAVIENPWIQVLNCQKGEKPYGVNRRLISYTNEKQVLKLPKRRKALWSEQAVVILYKEKQTSGKSKFLASVFS